MKALSQLWRGARIFGATFGHAAWVSLVHVAPAEKAALLAAAVGATETAYRQVLPPGKLSGWVTDLVKAYKVVQDINAQAAVPVPPKPAG